MKRYIFFALIICAIIKAGATDIGGILGNMTLTKANSPYVITKNTLIPSGVKVNVEPGVNVQFSTNASLQIDGIFLAHGLENDSIYFTRNGTSAGSIKIMDSAKNYESGNVTSFSYCSFPQEFYIQVSGSRPLITNCNYVGQISVWENGYPVISKNKIIGSIQALNSNFSISENDILGGVIIEGGYNAFVVNNVIHGGVNGVVYDYVYTGTIIGNYIYDMEKVAILARYLNSFGDTKIEIKCNSFWGNKGPNIELGCEFVPVIEHNNFFDYSIANVEIASVHYIQCNSSLPPGQYLAVNLKNNFWNGLSESEIEDSFVDFDDDFEKKVNVTAIENVSEMIYKEECLSGIVTSVKKSGAEVSNSINVFPNPSVGGAFTFTSDDCLIEEITLVNALNQQEVIKGNKVETSFKGLVTAIVKTNKGIFNKKIIIY